MLLRSLSLRTPVGIQQANAKAEINNVPAKPLEVRLNTAVTEDPRFSRSSSFDAPSLRVTMYPSGLTFPAKVSTSRSAILGAPNTTGARAAMRERVVVKNESIVERGFHD